MGPMCVRKREAGGHTHTHTVVCADARERVCVVGGSGARWGRETLFFWEARPMKEEWKISPYLGVFPLVLRARNSAFSAPRICTVDAGYFARFVREPA